VVRVDDDGSRGPDPVKQLTVDCGAASDSAACGEAAKVTAADLAPTPGDRACSQLYGGPQTASIRGTLRGRGVDATFSRINGCEIARWGRVSALLGEVR
jgi:O-acetylhomoserine/O-acetylserine sulfhydrylase-like pyridoxal-dependent enzyme